MGYEVFYRFLLNKIHQTKNKAYYFNILKLRKTDLMRETNIYKISTILSISFQEVWQDLLFYIYDLLYNGIFLA